ncbi:CsgG/HfaB family protein [Zestomonas carbonaria]|uniref:Curli production assembly/transport component CsgG n=1 Tax=Zestomonas carbonaria TaxID=2762745 RepID=A0A7U7EPV5_9GAMM|nr:CsgG/HfaB family protein [Pseudomonas carbonaria]CAD5108992.1 Curli production assembly/transport component CsgG [Pseudomonas carbonaria]
MNTTLKLLLLVLALQGCAVREPMPAEVDRETPTLTPRASTYYDLLALPRPKGQLVAAVYGFRDQTGQYKPTPASSFSTSVTQGAASMLVDALQASGWFRVLEREGLQNVLTERKIIRASQNKPNTPANIQTQLPPLQAANLLLEGGVIAYDTNIRSGGEGARYLGIGASREYRVDQVSVNLRAVDVRSGQVLANVMTSKTIYSVGRSAGVFKFIEFKELLEMEAGYTTNEPAQLCVLSAIEAAVAHLIAQGIERRLWQTAGGQAVEQTSLPKYLGQAQTL